MEVCSVYGGTYTEFGESQLWRECGIAILIFIRKYNKILLKSRKG